MLICGIDFEATSVEPKEARIIEIGAALWSTELQTPVALLSVFVDPLVEIPEEITKVTGITNEMVQEYGETEASAISKLEKLIDAAGCCMAHNGTQYDVPLWRTTLARYEKQDNTTLWIDSRTDIVFDDLITTRNLKYLAAEMGFTNPFPHRAVFDVLTMFRIASKFDWDAIIARAKEPTVYVQAVVSFDEKEKAKELRFQWFAPQKIWWKPMKVSDLEAMKSTCGFQTRLLAGPLE